MKCLVRMILAFAAFVVGARLPAQVDPQAFLKMPRKEAETKLTNAHPAAYLIYAGRVFSEGDKEAGVRWFYTGLLRFRFYLRANPNLPTDGDPALLASLNSAIGEMVYQFGAKTPDILIKQLEAALKWDASHENGFTSKTKFQAEYEQTKEELLQLKANVERNKAAIQARALGKDPMPAKWPPLVPAKSIKDIEGVFIEDHEALLGVVFFTWENYKVNAANEFELKAISGTRLLVIARDVEKRGVREIRRIEWDVSIEADAVVLRYKGTAAQLGLKEGGSSETVYLSRNTSGDLVMQRDSVIDGTTQKGWHEKESNQWWQRAKERKPQDTEAKN